MVNLLELLGFTLVVVAFGLVYVPLAFLVAGIFFIFTANVAAGRKKPSNSAKP